MWARWRSRYPIGWHRPLLALLLACLALPALASPPPADPPRPPNVASWVWERTAEGGETDFLIVLHQQADRGSPLHPAAGAVPREALVRRLRETALQTQVGLRALLTRRGVPYRPFYIINALAVRGDRGLVAELAARPEVARIVADPWVRVPLSSGSHPAPSAEWTPANLEWNVRRVNADDVWALGFTGEGVVVAGQDTGYDWDHPALIDSYRGWDGITVTHDANWHDAIHVNEHGTNLCGVDSPEPCDDQGHGTHTMGTMVGADGIGVAPEARWIGCRNMDNRWGKPSTYIECFEFFLAPYPVGGTPLQGNPSLAPDVINNSWYCPPAEGCDWWTLQAVVETVRAAGILVVVSAGNGGAGCETVQYPPAIYEASFSVGATDASDNIASFSSRGPVTADGSGRRKPDISAPGVNIRSSLPGGDYGWLSGTSMAGPHVAGVAALLWSAAPDLKEDVDATERVLEHSARPRTTAQGCGGDGSEDVPNNVYGWGIVDALEAVAGLEVDLRSTSAWVQPGAALTYVLTLTDTGYVPLTTTVTDTLPSHVVPGGVLTWTVVLSPGAVWTESIPVTVETDYTGPLTNTVEAVAQQGSADTDVVVTYALRPLYLPIVFHQG